MVNSSGILHGQDGLREVSIKDLIGKKGNVSIKINLRIVTV